MTPSPLDGIPLARSRTAIHRLADAAAEARDFFDRGEFEAAALEIDTCRQQLNTLAAIKREQKAEAR